MGRATATVLRDSAALATAIVHPTSYSTHEKILNDPQIQEFLRGGADARRRRGGAQREGAPARADRDRRDGKTTELVGIVLEPDEHDLSAPADTCKVLVHVRLGNTQKLRARSDQADGRMPDGREVAIPLKPDPAASEPGNPFEQSFVGHFTAGAKPGMMHAQAVVRWSRRQPRMVEQAVAVIAK